MNSASFTTTQVLVVGGGPAGSSTAWHLAKWGLDVTLVDRARFPRDKPCAEYLSPECARILSSMGALSHIETAGAAHLTGMLIKTPAGAAIRGEFIAQHGFRGFRDSGLALPRIALDAILLNRAREAGVNVVEGAKVESMLIDGNNCVGANVRIDGAMKEFRAKLVIGADGLRSVVARRLNLAHANRYPRRFAFVAHYHNVATITSLGEMHVSKDGYVGLADVGNGLVNVALVVPRKRGTILTETPEQFLSDWIDAQPELRERFRNAERVGQVKVTGPFASHAKVSWSPGAALVGDAADFFDPFTGEGIYAALRGGELLSTFANDAVRAATVARSATALAAYDRERKVTFSGKWRVEKFIGLSLAFPWLLERAAIVLQRDRALADLLVGIAGDFVPPRELLRLSVIKRLLIAQPKLSSLQHAHRS
ncbi:MAG: NAD(P)/FAD-dependent oxidoreductase [Gemmatimonadaceae bacterium]